MCELLHGRTQPLTLPLYIQTPNVRVNTGSLLERCETSLFVINNYIIYPYMYLYAV